MSRVNYKINTSENESSKKFVSRTGVGRVRQKVGLKGDYAIVNFDSSFISNNRLGDGSSANPYVYKLNIEDKLVITYGDKGCYYKRKLYPPPRKVEARDLSGAGDTFLAAFAVSMVKNDNINKAIDFAQECASKVVAKKGVTTI